MKVVCVEFASFRKLIARGRVDGSVELGTIWLVDLVESTRLATSVGPARADELRDEYFGLLREAIDSCGGREFKSTRDGLMVAFAYVLDEGSLDVFVDRSLVDKRLPGECFGEVALLRDQTRIATVHARSPSRVLVLERQAFLLAVGSHERSMRAADRLDDKRAEWAAARVPTVENRFRSLLECAPEADAGWLPLVRRARRLRGDHPHDPEARPRREPAHSRSGDDRPVVGLIDRDRPFESSLSAEQVESRIHDVGAHGFTALIGGT